MLVIYPKLKNGNIHWSCDNCDRTADVCDGGTNVVALICECDMKVHPECNHDWYYKGLHWERIPIETREDYLRKRNEDSVNTII